MFIYKKLLPYFVVFFLSPSLAFAEDSYGGFRKVLNNKPYAWTIVTKPHPVRRGEFSQRFELRDGDCGSAQGWDDCSADRERVEVEADKKFYMGDEVWIAWSVYLPSDFKDLTPVGTNIGQIGQHKGPRSNSKGFGGGPPFLQFNIKKNDLAMTWFEIKGPSFEDAQDEANNFIIFPSINSMKGKWSDFMIHVKFEREEGFLEVFVNGVKKLNIRKNVRVQYRAMGKNWNEIRTKDFIIFPPKENFYFKYGIYRPFITDYKEKIGSQLPTQVVYYDEVRIGASQGDVDPRGEALLAPVD